MYVFLIRNRNRYSVLGDKLWRSTFVKKYGKDGWPLIKDCTFKDFEEAAAILKRQNELADKFYRIVECNGIKTGNVPEMILSASRKGDEEANEVLMPGALIEPVY